MIILYVIILAAGFIALVKGADIFVDGSSALARNFNVSGLIIGLTIVALGTSAPELAVSTLAAVQGSNELALSNVIGSNTFNLLCVLGFCSIIHPLPVDRIVLKRDFVFSIAVTALLLVITCGSVVFGGDLLSYGFEQKIGTVSRYVGLILVILFAGYIAYLIHSAKKNPAVETAGEKKPMCKCVLLIIAGLILIVGGGQAVVLSAKEIARAAGLTETLIGLTIVAIGTSLPELVTSLVAARKGETELAIGNVVGSNIFNLVFILGVSTLINPIGVNLASLCDMTLLLFISALTFIFSFTSRRIARGEGLVMASIYAADVIFAVMR